MNARNWKWIGTAFIVFLVNTAYIASFADPTIFYMTNVLIHLGLGSVLFVALVYLLLRDAGLRRGIPVAAGFFVLAAGTAAFLVWTGAILEYKWVWWAHIGTAAVGLMALLPYVLRKAAEGGGWQTFKTAYAGALALLILLPAATATYRKTNPNPNDQIVNSLFVPTSMDEEGGGPDSPFFPSAAKTNVGGIIPSNFFMDSETCGECHKDIFEQWNGSAHRFGSFNNQFYRKSIEYMQDVVGTEPSKWCAGCHDHAVFFNGRFDRPIKEQIDTPEAHAGLACTSCHAITQVAGSTGNGGFLMEYPPLHELATSKNPYIRKLDRFLTYLDPEPHRKTFMKPFMRGEDSPEYCASCHKVHLDVPVNQYRWLRGFNDYDAWQASGVSGQGARSFYYPAASQTCIDCHMPLVDSKDPGNQDGKVNSHRFPGGNTALPHVNKDAEQMKTVEAFLKSGFVTVDIFAASPADEAVGETQMVRRSGDGQQSLTSFAVGEEAESSGEVFIREVGKISAPIGRADTRLEPGSAVKIDVVVRTRRIGHFFPGGTVDAFDVWLELQGRDADGRIIYWSGQVTEDGKGPVEPGAHFYRSYQLDAEGNPINKRNAWQSRSLLYVRLVPPGAADVAHYLVRIPKDAKGPITFTAKLNYRKFAHYYTQFAYAGQPKPGQDASLINAHYNSAEYSFDPANIPKNVSGKIKDAIPDLPIVLVAQDSAVVPIGAMTEWKPVAEEKDRERWNDWGIGLLLQGDLKGAEYAFKKVIEAEPGYADGWLNVARAMIQEGETEAAKPYIKKALELGLQRAYYFKGLIEKTDGDYDAALTSFRKIEALFPRDRVVLNQMARVLFLKREYAEALKVLERVCLIDPEDVQMHYTAMLCYRGLGDQEKAAREETLFKRFKAEESSQAITARRRMVSPEDNNERQMIHYHESVALEPTPKGKSVGVVMGKAPAQKNTPVGNRQPAVGGSKAIGSLPPSGGYDNGGSH
ncbi:MAG: tetratricopeptide repeat protein [candidate division Zixibacteria bacterium]|nr:tetratricopeptide repeat protein [candidate division Zixibacteria bacterium]